jgi:hypothetical protein
VKVQLIVERRKAVLARIGFAGLMSVRDQEDLSFASLLKFPEKQDERSGVELPAIPCRPELASRIERAVHVDALTLAGSCDDLGRSLEPVSSTRRRVGLKSCLIRDEDHRPPSCAHAS